MNTFGTPRSFDPHEEAIRNFTGEVPADPFGHDRDVQNYDRREHQAAERLHQTSVRKIGRHALEQPQYLSDVLLGIDAPTRKGRHSL